MHHAFHSTHFGFARQDVILSTPPAEVGRLLEGEIDELPDLTNAEKIMTDFKLDEDWQVDGVRTLHRGCTPLWVLTQTASCRMPARR